MGSAQLTTEGIKSQITKTTEAHVELSIKKEKGDLTKKEYDSESLILTKELTEFLEKIDAEDLSNDNLQENIPGLNLDLTYQKLLEEVNFINNFGNLIKRGDDIEDAISLIFNADETTIKLTHLFQKYITEDLKSDLTEEFAWIYDYIRNIASEEQKAKLLENLKPLNESNKKGKEATRDLRNILIPIKLNINANQLKNGLHMPFYFEDDEKISAIVSTANSDKINEEYVKEKMNSFGDDKDKARGFKKASGGLPDVVSINPDTKKVHFTAANSLSSLTMESDQLERHSAMIALAISLCDDYPKDFSEKLNDVTFSMGDIESQRNLYFSMWYLTPEYKHDDKVLNLKKLQAIWNEEVDITFFQTYASKNIIPAVANEFVNRNNSDIKNTRDTYRKVNERTRALLANSQTIANEAFKNSKKEDQEYPSEAIRFHAQNNKSSSKELKPVNDNIQDFKNDILKVENIGEHLNHLVELPKSHKEGENEIKQAVDFAMEQSLDKMDEKSMKEFFSSDYIDNYQNDEEQGKLFRSRVIGILNNVVIPYLDSEGMNNLEKIKPEILNKEGCIDESFKGDLSVVVNKNTGRIKESVKVGDQKKPIKKLSDDRHYTLTDLSLINMLGSSDLLRTSALVNIAVIYRDEYKKSEDPDLLKKLKDLRSYSIKSLSSYGQDTSKDIETIIKEVEKLAEKDDVIAKMKEQMIKMAIQSNGVDAAIGNYFTKEEYESYMKTTEQKAEAKAEDEKTKTNKAIDILSRMQNIYKPKTSKGDLLKAFKEAFEGSATGSNLPEGLEADDIGNKQVVAEYVISMKFAEDMETQTVQGILASEPLSKFFNEDEIKQILTEIDTRPNPPKQSNPTSIINFPPKPNAQ